MRTQQQRNNINSRINITTDPTISSNEISINPNTGSITTSATPAYTVSSSYPMYSNIVYNTTAAIDTVGYCWNNDINPLINYLSESELSVVINKITSRMDKEDNKEVKAFIAQIVRRRHFSEDFLMSIIDFITKADIMVLHEADIRSGEYSQLALYFKTLD